MKAFAPNILRLSALALALAVSACANFQAPDAKSLAKLPVVSYPNTPTTDGFVYKIPAGQAVAMQVNIRGTALASTAQQVMTVTLPKDVYVHKRWVSEDGQNWQPAQEVFNIQLQLSLPSDESPKPGEILLTVDRRNKS